MEKKPVLDRQMCFVFQEWQYPEMKECQLNRLNLSWMPTTLQ